MELWPKWHFNRFSILSTALHVHFEVNCILLECFPLHMVALILDTCLCSSNYFWMLTQRCKPFVFYGMLTKEAVTLSWRSWNESLWAQSIHVTLHFAPKENHPAVQGQAVVQATQCCAPVRQFVRKQFLQCSQLRVATVLWQVAPSWKNHTLRMTPLRQRWSPINHVRF